MIELVALLVLSLSEQTILIVTLLEGLQQLDALDFFGLRGLHLADRFETIVLNIIGLAVLGEGDADLFISNACLVV